MKLIMDKDGQLMFADYFRMLEEALKHEEKISELRKQKKTKSKNKQ